jgi:hypothetical protein
MHQRIWEKVAQRKSKINVLALRAMEKQKGNELGLLWKKSVAWDSMTKKQKLIAIWFSLSFVGVGVFGCSEWWITVLALVNFVAAASCAVKYIPIPEED